MKTIIVILGTRPEAIKLAPVILELRKQPEFHVLVCNTEQQKELSNQTLSFFGIEADYKLNVMRPNQSLAGVQSRILSALSDIYEQNKIDATIVQGDTMTVFCGALVSFYNKIPVYHVEAGLRSYDLFEPFPEEAMRQMTARITDLHFAPTPKAAEALKQEGIPAERIHMTGNTVIDALTCLSPETICAAEKKLSDLGIKLNDKLVLITAHRRENHGERLDRILSAIGTLTDKYSDHQFVLPVHPNPNVHDKVYAALESKPNVILTSPMDYPELVCMMKHSKLVLTDSGGIQEEAPTFGNPVLVMRYETERTEGIDAGFAKLVGADIDLIVSECSNILSIDKAATRLDGSKNPYGDGRSSRRIVQIMLKN
ncbi:MAG: UDP-N-acetylglucosamine 2-epimerase (non-hydrolyzing) [bacterium]|nr:UDP-N-acetylglucosamine 2-epimerase (non-hydrolyzing) [bacterium]